MRSRKHYLSMAVVACALALSSVAMARAAVQLTHVHGLSYSADGTRLMIPSHHGLAIYQSGQWSKAPGAAHDYMGFSATRDHLFSSGHPAPGSGMTNPFGLIKSADGGKTWQKLGLTGESDFHLLASGYESNAVYVFNHQPNSRMDQAGIYHTVTDGFKWERSSAKGLSGDINSLAVHPTDPKIVAVGTSKGLYLSRDSGDQFEALVSGSRVLGESFALDGRHLWFSSIDGKPSLSRIALRSGARAEKVSTPPLPEDAIAYIAHNPAKPNEIAIASFKRSVFISKDSGQNWSAIATLGVGHE